jgi:hypothetical protein
MPLTLEKLEEIIGEGTEFFAVSFVKKDGTLREMQCRRGVKKYLKGGELAYNPRERNLLTVWDVNAPGAHSENDVGYRMINVSTIQTLKAHGRIWVVKEDALVEVTE